MTATQIQDQTQAVYAAEDLWSKREANAQIRFGDWHEVQPFYVNIAATFRATGEEVYPPTVQPRKGALAAHYDHTARAVFIPPYDRGGVWALTTGTAIHEFAHHIAPPDAGHGPKFRAAMLEILDVIGWNRDLLEECYANVGLSTSDKAEGITDKVNKLLTHADKAGTDAERRTYLEKAESMAAEHSINLALIRKRQADTEDKDRDRPTTGKLYSLCALPNTTYRNLAVELGTNIAYAHGAQCAIRGKSSYLTFYGFQEDIDLTELMVTRVTPMMFEEADRYLKSPEHKASGVAAVSARITFCKNFAAEVGYRLKEAVSQTEKTVAETLALTDGSTSTELVMREKAVEVADYVDHEFKKIGIRKSWKGSDTSTWSGEAANAGTQAGRNADLFGRKELG